MPTLQKNLQKKIVILASGSGTNAENIIRHFQGSNRARVEAVLCNKRSAQVLQRALTNNVRAFYFDRESLYKTDEVLHLLGQLNPDLIVLAGFLWIVPDKILKAFPDRVINIHPALLPKFGGKGMYGNRVHQAVLDQKEKQTGISIHYVNPEYDEGEVIFQKSVPVESTDSVEDIKKKIHQLEYTHFPKVIEKLLFPKNE